MLRIHGAKLATYNMDTGPLGFLELREFIAGKLRAQRGIEAHPDEILITSGSLQGMDLINELMIQPGDTVLVEEHSYGGAISRLNQIGAKTVAMPLDHQGIRTDSLASILDRLKGKGTKPKHIYTIPTIQNPTASIMPIERRHQLLKLSNAFGVPIYEDECYADLLWAGDWPPAIRAFDDGNQVIHIGSFSKNLAPALRLGYVTAAPDIIGRLVALKNDGGTPAIEQMVVADFFRQHFDDHIDRLRETLERKRNILIHALEEQFGTSAEFARANGGIFQWVRLPDAVDTSELAKAASEEGIAINPGREWSVEPESGKHWLRICFANPSEQQLVEGIAKLATICHREFGVPARSGNIQR
ncbi:MAG: PLP-dependent aminotransferase family protein [Pseudomonadota bacterium]